MNGRRAFEREAYRIRNDYLDSVDHDALRADAESIFEADETREGARKAADLYREVYTDLSAQLHHTLRETAKQLNKDPKILRSLLSWIDKEEKALNARLAKRVDASHKTFCDSVIAREEIAGADLSDLLSDALS